MQKQNETRKTAKWPPKILFPNSWIQIPLQMNSTRHSESKCFAFKTHAKKI